MPRDFTDKDLRVWQSEGKTYHKLYVNYADLIDAPLWWHERGLQQTVSGYGNRLTNRYKIKFNGRLYRLYTTIFSNNGSTWFVTKGRKVFVD